jgi:orotate phosphoribosyltransferase
LPRCAGGAGKAAGVLYPQGAKGHGTDQRIDGLSIRSRIILLEDATTGGSALRAAEEARRIQCTILKIITVVDRLEGAEANFRSAGIPFEALFTRSDFD